MSDRIDGAAADGVAVREATPDERAAVLNVLDGAALETDTADAVSDGIERGDVLVAVSNPERASQPDRVSDPEREPNTEREPDDRGSERIGTVVGALVLDGPEITSVAVRRLRRGQGIGTALVDAATSRRDRLVAEFDPGVRPFYESLGFTVESVDGGRCRGRLVRSDD